LQKYNQELQSKQKYLKNKDALDNSVDESISKEEMTDRFTKVSQKFDNRSKGKNSNKKRKRGNADQDNDQSPKHLKQQDSRDKELIDESI
jgi:hypothetical protein